MKWKKTIRRVLKEGGATASEGMKTKLLRKKVLAAVGPQPGDAKELFRAKLASCKEARPSADGKRVFLDRRKK